ncbi:hypothetical protein Y1Q_0001544 [Alligator mississippiensis]|uniref:Uncharacterized protein n=1 Tax=Alligator mississippiensis TaxID=8496 RepID=A0A151M9U2_ALLMI|nr:hypothetical protein Y1Q_0001544 [Alligator mississippiensis]
MQTDLRDPVSQSAASLHAGTQAQLFLPYAGVSASLTPALYSVPDCLARALLILLEDKGTAEGKLTLFKSWLPFPECCYTKVHKAEAPRNDVPCPLGL